MAISVVATGRRIQGAETFMADRSGDAVTVRAPHAGRQARKRR